MPELIRLNDFARLGKAALSQPPEQRWTPGVVQFVVPGEPATKKTGQRIVKNKQSGRVKVIPSQRTLSWTVSARMAMQGAMRDLPPIPGRVAVDYTFYRAKNVADLGGMEAAMDDAMQDIVIVNDRQIVQRTSRREVDKANPRAVVRVTLWLGR